MLAYCNHRDNMLVLELAYPKTTALMARVLYRICVMYARWHLVIASVVTHLSVCNSRLMRAKLTPPFEQLKRLNSNRHMMTEC